MIDNIAIKHCYFLIRDKRGLIDQPPTMQYRSQIYCFIKPISRIIQLKLSYLIREKNKTELLYLSTTVAGKSFYYWQ